MKIALLGPFLSCNHGTVLQAFALSKVLRDNKQECEYIQTRLIKDGLMNRLLFILKHPLALIRLKRYSEKKRKDLKYEFQQSEDYQVIFNKNRKFCIVNTPIRKDITAYDELCYLVPQYDLFMVGSDQTWSPNAFYQYSPNYLDFVDNSQKKCSYGSSFGTTDLPSKFVRFVIPRLVSFAHLSCRDFRNSKVLRSMTHKEVTYVVDPTLLVNSSEWKKYMEPMNNMPSKYILCYILGEKQCIIDYAESLGRKTGIPVRYIQTRPINVDEDKVIKHVGTPNFLWLINNCAYMITDSFHGTIFSINFRKQFVSFNKHEGNAIDNGRIIDILQQLGLENHFMNDDESRIVEDITDYNKVHEKLDLMKESSMSYLMHVIKCKQP